MKPLKQYYPPDTLGYHYKMSTVLFGPDSEATKFLVERAERSRFGFDEPVLAPEEQMVQLLGQLHAAWLTGQPDEK